MQGRRPKFKVPTRHGHYEAHSPLQVLAVVSIEVVRKLAFGVGVGLAISYPEWGHLILSATQP